MKKLQLLPLVALLAFMPLCAAFADEKAPVPPLDELGKGVLPYVQLDILCAQKVYGTADGMQVMQSLSKDLDPFYADFLYSRYRKDIGSAVLLNVLTGGLGSWNMGDKLSGALLESGMIASYGCSVAAIILSSQNANTSKSFTTGALVSAGLVITGGILMPILHGRKENQKIALALSLGQ